MNQIKQFLIVFDRKNNELMSASEFSNEKEALDTLFREERINGANPNLEIVLLGARSLEVLRTTHGHYFNNSSQADILKMVSA